MNRHFSQEETAEMVRMLDEKHMTIGEVARRYDTNMNIVRNYVEIYRREHPKAQGPKDSINSLNVKLPDDLIDKILHGKNSHLSKTYIAQKNNVTLEVVDYVLANYKDRFAELYSKPAKTAEAKEQPEPKKEQKETSKENTPPQEINIEELARYYNQGATWEELNSMFGLNNNSLAKAIREAKARGLVPNKLRKSNFNANKKPEPLPEPAADTDKPKDKPMSQTPTTQDTDPAPQAVLIDMDEITSNDLFKELQRRGYRLEGGKVYQKKTFKVDIESVLNIGKTLHPVKVSLMDPKVTNEDLIYELHRRGFRIQDNTLYQVTDIEIDLHKMVHPK